MTPPRPQKLAVVTPLANERATLDDFTRRVLAQLQAQDQLIMVFDTASTDGSLARAHELAAADPRINVVFAPETQSVVDAYFRGYREALATDADWILEIDGGLSHLPEEIPPFIAAMQNGYDYAGGSRFMTGGGFDGPWSRYLISRGGTWLTNRLVGTTMHDMTSGFECFTRAALQFVVTRGVRSRAHFFQTEIRAMMQAHFRWTEIPIHYGCPSKSVGKSSLTDAFKSLAALRRDYKARSPR